MKIRQRNSFFILESSSGSFVESEGLLNQASHYHPLILTSLALGNYTIEGIQALSNQLQAVARQAHVAKQFDVVEQASKIMLALPLPDQQRLVASYYQAVCAKRQGNLEQARLTLDKVAEGATPQYRARALLTIGATYYEGGQANSALAYYLSAGKAATDCDLLTLTQSQCMVAVIRSIYGDHRHALAELENLFPLIRAVGRYYPAFYYDYLNSLAVELGEAGRIDEARAALAIALASPFAQAHPNWYETQAELDEKRASAQQPVLAVNSIEEAAAPQENSERKLAPRGSPALYLPVIIGIILVVSPTTVVATTAIAHFPFSRTTLERLGRAFGPRAPPTYSRYNKH